MASFRPRDRRSSSLTRLAGSLGLLLILGAGGCATTDFYERERLAHEAMQLDADGPLSFLRNKIEAAREGALGGYGTTSAGECGCQ